MGGERWLCGWGAVAMWVGRGGYVGGARWVCGSPSNHLETWAISFTPHCLCLSEDTLKVVGPFYQMSIPGEPITGKG